MERAQRTAPSLRASLTLVCAILTLPLCASLRAGPSELQFCTLLGGEKWERVQAVCAGADGCIYVAGSTKSTRFPTTPGAYDTAGSTNDANDGFVAKLAPDGTRLIWSTYLHGSSRDDVYGVRADAQGFVYAVGWTRSVDFPTTPGAYDRTHNGEQDVFLAKLAPDGGALVFSTFYGGAGIDQCRGGMDFDAGGAIYLSGYTDSTDFPVTGGAIQRSFKGGYGDAFIGKLSADGSALLFSTYLGSTGPDHAFPGLCVHTDGSIVVTGVAGASDFPTTPGAYQPAFAGTQTSDVWYGDAFVARFSLTPEHRHTLHYITFLGGSGMEKSTAQHGIALDRDGSVVVALTTHSGDFPTTASACQKTLTGANNVAIARLSFDGATLMASTYLGGTAGSGYEPSGLALDAAGNVFVAGSIYGGIADHPVTADAFRRTSGGEDEAFFAILSPDLSRLRYSTYFGGAGNDRIRDLARTSGGDVVLGGDTYSTDLPLTPGAFQRDHAGEGDAYVARFTGAAEVLFRRGDANGLGDLDVADAIFVLSYMFAGGVIPSCFDAADANDDGAVDLADAIKLLGHLFAGAGPLPDPFEACGADPAADDLACFEFDPCG